jgi:hypothetical protein
MHFDKRKTKKFSFLSVQQQKIENSSVHAWCRMGMHTGNVNALKV